MSGLPRGVQVFVQRLHYVQLHALQSLVLARAPEFADDLSELHAVMSARAGWVAYSGYF